MREFRLRAGAGFCVFKESGCENRKGKVAGCRRYLIFTRLDDFTRGRLVQMYPLWYEMCRPLSNESAKAA